LPAKGLATVLFPEAFLPQRIRLADQDGQQGIMPQIIMII
jgi:hypothetical protein